MTSPANLTPPPEACEDEPKATFMEHLEELRRRIFRALLYIMLGWVVAFALTPYVYDFLATPLLQIKPEGTKFVFTHATEPFFLKLKLALILGLILVMPLIMGEVWGFVAPGLTRQERRAVKLIAPFSLCLFFGGVALGYYILPAAFRFFLSYLDDYPDAQLLQNPAQYIMFVVKMMFAFGLGFQTPVVLVFLAHVGIVTPEAMWRHWRYAILIIGLLSALLTPSGDAFSMVAIGLPMVFLYFLSVALVAWIARRRQRQALRFETR
ncbi:MAG: twin-arginine translocase subunit TatC [Fimbriimonadales bacterium]|nr:twin-arginine translocase subunit TatC [Fimbriimonadales bacterium]MDW8051024.1 twin-arginine translocase subunit TatC [Armatimonadota bacterium]